MAATPRLANEPEQQVLSANVIVVQGLGLILGQDDDPAGPIGEPFEHELSLYVGQTNPRKYRMTDLPAVA